MKKEHSNQNVKVGKMVVFVKSLNHYHDKFQLFLTVLYNCKGIWNWKFRSKFNHGYLHSAVWKALHDVKIKRAQRARHNQFFSSMFTIMRSLRSSKCLRTTVESTFTTKKTKACSSSTASSVFDWKYFFWVNLVQKLKIISFQLKFCI